MESTEKSNSRLTIKKNHKRALARLLKLTQNSQIKADLGALMSSDALQPAEVEKIQNQINREISALELLNSTLQDIREQKNAKTGQETRQKSQNPILGNIDENGHFEGLADFIERGDPSLDLSTIIALLKIKTAAHLDLVKNFVKNHKELNLATPDPHTKENLSTIYRILAAETPDEDKLTPIFQEFQKIEKRLNQSNPLQKAQNSPPEAPNHPLENRFKVKEATLAKLLLEKFFKPTAEKSTTAPSPGTTTSQIRLKHPDEPDTEPPSPPLSSFDEGEKLTIQVTSDLPTSPMMQEAPNNYSFLAYGTNQNSYLCDLYGFGICLVRDNEVIFEQNSSEQCSTHVLGLVYASGSFFIYDWNEGKGRIVRKGDDGLEPVIWWDREEILYLRHAHNQLRAGLAGQAIAVNKSSTELLIIGVNQQDGSPGNTITIENTSGSRIDSHVLLSKDYAATVTKYGVLSLYSVNLPKSEYRALQHLDISLKPQRYEKWFYLAHCPKDRYLAVLIYYGEASASRIQIYQLLRKTPKEEARLEYRTELDLYHLNLGWFCSVCFSEYFGDKVMVVGYAYLPRSIVEVYCYDTKLNNLFKHRRIYLAQNSYCFKLSRFGDEMYSILGNRNRLRIFFGVYEDGEGEEVIVGDGGGEGGAVGSQGKNEKEIKN